MRETVFWTAAIAVKAIVIGSIRQLHGSTELFL